MISISEFYNKFWVGDDKCVKIPEHVLNTLDAYIKKGHNVVNSIMYPHYSKQLVTLQTAIALYNGETVTIVADKRKSKDYFVSQLKFQYNIEVNILEKSDSIITVRIRNFDLIDVSTHAEPNKAMISYKSTIFEDDATNLTKEDWDKVNAVTANK
jgi:hypothetical protein